MRSPTLQSVFTALGALLTLFALGCGGGGGGGRHDSGGGGLTYSTSPTFIYSTQFGMGHVNGPDAIATDTAGNIYVASYGIAKVSEFDKSGVFLRDIGVTGDSSSGKLLGPQGVYVDASGNIWVTDTDPSKQNVQDASNNKVVEYGPNFAFKQNVLIGKVGFPWQITGDASGALYTTTSANLKTVIKFNASGAILGQFGDSTGPGALGDTDGVAVDSSGNVFVSDYAQQRIVEFDKSGTYLKSFGGPLEGPQGISLSSTGIFVADVNANAIFHYDLSGNLIDILGAYSGSAALASPYDVHVDSTGRLLIADSSNNRVAVYVPSAVGAKK